VAKATGVLFWKDGIMLKLTDRMVPYAIIELSPDQREHAAKAVLDSYSGFRQRFFHGDSSLEVLKSMEGLALVLEALGVDGFHTSEVGA